MATPERPDAQIAAAQRNDGQDDARTRLAQAMQDRSSGTDQVIQAAAPQDRAKFVSDIGQRVQQMATSLHQAGDGMKAFNTAAETGRLQPGTDAYNQAYNDASLRYKKAIQDAANNLFSPDAQGKPTASDMSKAVVQELIQTQKEKQVLLQMAKAGQQLTQEQAQAIGVTSLDPRAAFMQKKQSAETLSDFLHAVSYAEANYGLGLIRSSKTMTGDLKGKNVEEGERMIQAAFGMDGNMQKDANFWAHYINDCMKAGVQPRRQPPTQLDAGPYEALKVSADAPANPGDRPGTTGPAGTMDMGRYHMPRGTNRPDTPGFVDPDKVQADADKAMNPNGQLTPQDVNNLYKAIQTADSVDRDWLEQQMPKENAALRQMLDNDQSGQLRARVQAKRTQITARDQADDGIQKLIAPVTKAAGDGTPQLIDQMTHMQSVADLQKFANDNAQSINAIKGVQGGPQLLNQVQQRVAIAENLHKLDGEIAQINPDFAKTWDALNEHKRLYLSSTSTRAHALDKLVPHLNEDPKVKEAAQKLFIQMCQYDEGTIKNTDSQNLARGLGLDVNKLANMPREPKKDAPGTAGNNGADVIQPIGMKPDSSSNAVPTDKALALYNQVMDHVHKGQPISQDEKTAFEGLIKDAGSLDQNVMNTEKQRLDQMSQQVGGGGKSVEQHLQELLNDKSANAQQNLNAYLTQPDIKKYADERRNYNIAMNGDKIVEGMYGLALLRGSKEQDDINKGKTLITDAMNNDVARGMLGLDKVMDQLNGSGVPTSLGTGDTTKPGDNKPSGPAQPTRNPLYDKVPGMENLDNAEKIMSDKSLSAQDALKKAQDDLQKGYDASKQIDTKQEAAKYANPAALQQNGQLTLEGQSTNVRMEEPMRARMLYATALNHAAVELYNQANGNPAQAAAMNAQADKWNNDAIAKLQEMKTVDPNYGTMDPNRRTLNQNMIEGEILMAQKHQPIGADKGIATSLAASATTHVNNGLNSWGYQAMAPVGVATDVISPLGIFPSFSTTERPYAVAALSRAIVFDDKIAQQAVDEGKQSTKDKVVHTAIDLFSGAGAMYAAEKLIPAALSANPVTRLGAALVIDGALTKGLDMGAHQVFNTTELDNASWMSHTAASFGAASLITGAAGLSTRLASGAVKEGTVARALEGVEPNLARMPITGTTEAERSFQFINGLKGAAAESQDAMVAARAKQYWYSPRQLYGSATVDKSLQEATRYASNVPEIGQTITTPELVKLNTGVDLGSRSAYLNLSNMRDGFMQKTLQVGEDGKLIGSVRDMAARAAYAKVGPAVVTGGLSAGIYSNADVNPWLKKQDGTYYSNDEWAKNMGWSTLMGGAASGIVAPAVPFLGRQLKEGLVVGPARWIGNVSQRYAPEWSAKVAGSGLAKGVTELSGNLSKGIAAEKNWVFNPNTDLGTIISSPASGRNFINTLTREYAQPLALPLWSGVGMNAWGYHEWNVVNDDAHKEAQRITDEMKRREDEERKAREAQARQGAPSAPAK